MNKILSIAVASALFPTGALGATELSLGNYKELMTGRNSFIKFLAPWWGHCKSMKPAWDRLGDDYAASSSVLIADVDCTAEGEEVCSKFDVKGYPTIKYFLNGDEEGEDYKGGRDYDSLKKHVEENLEIKCDVTDPVGCTDKEKAYIEKMKQKTIDERGAQITRLDKMKGDSMKADLKQWLIQRLHILNSLSSDEL